MAFNWDCLDIGNVELEHSQNYFDVRHIEHERLGEQCEELIEQMIPHSKPIAVFKGKRLFKSNEFESPAPKKKLEVKRSQRLSEKSKPVMKSKLKTAAPLIKKKSLPEVSTRLSTRQSGAEKQIPVTRTSRLIQHAQAYAEKRRAMLERHRKEQEEKNKPKKFRARSVPKYIKERRKRSTIDGNKENVEKS
ncbi:uncharacterized protein LOC134834242 [Culicoides brevitarsis]|uniref:uncharacterized protein LOC134834242 n=1 Tax=Culicoides brevitarsis TaxID=469753 RepID=UPI00307B4C5C